MSTRIRILPDEVVNRIAAGEAVERPASVVKELVENAIDAGADRIVIEAAAGGKEALRVTDNGCGMSHDDGLLALGGARLLVTILVIFIFSSWGEGVSSLGLDPSRLAPGFRKGLIWSASDTSVVGVAQPPDHCAGSLSSTWPGM